MNDTTNKFQVVNESEARLLIQEKIGKVLALSRLQDQVSNLQEKVSELPKNKPLLVVAVDLFLSTRGLKMIKKWASSMKYLVIVSNQVVQELDFYKSGDDRRSACARDSIRFLEEKLRFSNQYVRIQKKDEVVDIDWEKIEISGIAKVLRLFFEATKFYHENYSNVSIASEDEGVIAAAHVFGIPIFSG